MIKIYVIGSREQVPLLLLAYGYEVTTDLLGADGCALMPGWSQSAEAMEAYVAAFRAGIPCRPLKEWL